MSVVSIIDRTKEALKTGRWWIPAWWRDNIYYEDDTFDRDIADAAFNELVTVFDAKWMIEQKSNGNPPFPHQIANQLVTEGHLSFQFLYELGVNLLTVKAANLLGDIERRLKSYKEYWEAAAFELQLLSCFIRAGYAVERNYPSGKGRCNCDLKVSKRSETYFLEIKRPRELSVQNKQIINKTQSQFFTKLMSNDIIQEEDITSSRLSSRAEVDKVFRLIRYAANKQIPEIGPGIVIIESPYILDWNEFEFAVMDGKKFQRRKKYPALSAVILTQPFFHSGKICYTNHIVFNPQATINIKSSAIMEIFTESSR